MIVFQCVCMCLCIHVHRLFTMCPCMCSSVCACIHTYMHALSVCDGMPKMCLCVAMYVMFPSLKCFELCHMKTLTYSGLIGKGKTVI